MKLWLDQHLSPQLARWITGTFRIEALHVRDLGLARARDREVFEAARKADAVILTKDADFIGLLEGWARRQESSGSRAATCRTQTCGFLSKSS